ncbi:hypothetical protein LOTGIDRAFT_175462 [Lottia gigantea]|uniref:Uncharacterized protein n=1 Tax=Lottia gigantea TaxID=225164 RepID=V4ALD2_LOTGI|nr:hypothetical protein LOTGIDRAFT_175462 [Lottia gigantea]ESO94386.1 hypothetical protein LOTGIDRAFT_175462 [Lottia gigantea]
MAAPIMLKPGCEERSEGEYYGIKTFVGISNPGSLCPPIIPPEIEYEDEAEITMIDQSLDIEDANDLDFVPDTESESDSEYDQDPSDEQPLATDFEDIESFSVPENAADERQIPCV